MVVVALLATSALAQPQVASAPAGGGMGAGMMGGGMGRGQMMMNARNTPGWSLMSAEERAAFQQKMRTAKTYDECRAIQAEHHKTMEARAAAQGKTLPPMHANVCDRMKARGWFKTP